MRARACVCAPQVIVEGFKSYKEQIITEPFSPKLNTLGARRLWRRAPAHAQKAPVVF